MRRHSCRDATLWHRPAIGDGSGTRRPVRQWSIVAGPGLRLTAQEVDARPDNAVDSDRAAVTCQLWKGPEGSPSQVFESARRSPYHDDAGLLRVTRKNRNIRVDQYQPGPAGFTFTSHSQNFLVRVVW